MKKLKHTPQRDLYLNLVKAHEKLIAEFSALFRDHGLTLAQFNVLRILLGAPDGGVPCLYVGEQLMHRLPDVTRLLDRMEKAELVQRARSLEDRRVVLVSITRKGKKLCEDLYVPVSALHRKQAAHLPASTIAALNRGLAELLD